MCKSKWVQCASENRENENWSAHWFVLNELKSNNGKYVRQDNSKTKIAEEI